MTHEVTKGIQLRQARVSATAATAVSRWFTLAAFVVAAVALAFAPFLAWSWSSRPFPGFVVEQTLVVAGYDGPGWSGHMAGISHPQRITHLDGRALHTRADFVNALDALTRGQQISVDTVSPDGMRHTYPAVRVQRFSPGDLLRMFWLPFAVGLAHLLAGAGVYRVRGHTPPGRAFAVFCASAALTTGLQFDLVTTHAAASLWTVAMAGQGAALISLALLFPEQWAPLERGEWLRFLPYCLTVALAAWGLAALHDGANPWAFVTAWRASFAYSALGIAAFLGTMLYRLRTSNQPVARQQSRVILWGALIAFLPIGVWLAAPLFGAVIRFNPALFLPFLPAFPLSIAVAIRRYRLWDLDLIVSRTLVYAALTVTLGLVYSGGVLALQQLLLLFSTGNLQLAVAASTLGIALLFNPVRLRLQDAIDRRFYRRRYDAARTLSSLGPALRDEVDLTRLTDRLETVVWETLQPAHVFTWLRQEQAYRPFLGDEVGRKWVAAEVPAGDPLVTRLRAADGAVELRPLDFDSPARAVLAEAGAELAVPLMSQGELIGWLSLGPRLSQGEYSAADRALLWNLGAQAGAALRVAQLVRQQQVEVLARERIEYELRMAQQIQQTLLPQAPPALPGWELAVHYQPAGPVGGDFYDFLVLPDGHLFLAVGDVTDQGVPAALIMASVRSILRGTARRMLSPGAALAQANTLLHPELPPGMFVTCLYASIDPDTGRMRYANAGHTLPLRRSGGTVTELRATGMRLGVLPSVGYEEKETTIAPGEGLVVYSDGLIEAHNAAGEMFGAARLGATVASAALSGHALIVSVLAELAAFAEPAWGQEDDVTLLVLNRRPTEPKATA